MNCLSGPSPKSKAKILAWPWCFCFCSLASLSNGKRLLRLAIAALVVDMTFPQFYRPVAVLWLGLSHLLGTVVSKILLTLVFFGVVTPIGLARKVLGFDSLKLKNFKSGENSVMVIRNHIFTGKDIEKPY